MIYIFCDGASKGNPGKSSIGAFGYIDEREFFLSAQQAQEKRSEFLFVVSQRIADGTNNQAEYRAVLAAVEKLKQLQDKISPNEKAVTIFLDSQLVVEQINGRYKVKNANMKPLFIQLNNDLNQLRQRFQFSVQHIERQKNQAADYFANLAFTHE